MLFAVLISNYMYKLLTLFVFLIHVIGVWCKLARPFTYMYQKPWCVANMCTEDENIKNLECFVWGDFTCNTCTYTYRTISRKQELRPGIVANCPETSGTVTAFFRNYYPTQTLPIKIFFQIFKEPIPIVV